MKKKPDRAYTEYVVKTRKFEKVKIPEGEFNLVVFDLPFGFKMQLQGSSNENYQTYQTPEEYLIAFPPDKIKKLFAKDCIVVFWSWPSRTRDVQSVMDAYGAKEITAAVWAKTTKDNGKYKIGMGTRFRSVHENMIICEIGKPPVPDEANRPISIFSAPVNAKIHSEKPDRAYDILNRMYPTLDNKLDFFGRKERKGFTVFGNQKLDDDKIHSARNVELLSNEEDFMANERSWSSDDVQKFLDNEPQICSECGEESYEFEHNTYGRKCANCYKNLRKLIKENKGIMTIQVYDEFQNKFGSKHTKVKKINKSKMTKSYGKEKSSSKKRSSSKEKSHKVK